MQSRDKECLLSFIDISRPTPESLAITAQFRNETDIGEFTTATAIQKLDERQEKTLDTTAQNVVSNFVSNNYVDLEKGGVALFLNPEIRLQRTYYIPPIGWNSLAFKLLRGEHSEAFVPVFQTNENTGIDVKVWEIHYPPNIETNKKYRTTKWEDTKRNKQNKK